MPIISFICILIFSITFITGFRKNADFLSPGRIFILLWSFVIGLTEFKFSFIQLEWTTFDWFMVLIGLLTFIIGVYISFLLNIDKPFLPVSQIRKKIRRIEINERLLFNIILIYFIIYSLFYIIEWQIEGYIPLLTPQPEKARKLFGIFGIHLVVQSVNVILFLIIQYYIFIKANFGKKILLFIILIISTGSFLLLLQRYNFVILILMGISLFYYSGRNVNFKTFLISAAIIIIFIVGIQTLRASTLFTAYFFYLSKMKFSADYAALSVPYMYIVMNLETFVNYFPKIETHSFGYYTFDFITAISGVKHWIAEYFNFEKFKDLQGYNTYPFYWAYYYDFGIIGLSLIPFFLGFIFSEIYYLLHRNPNLVILSLYTIVFSVIAISYSSDPLTRLDMMFNFALIILIQFFIVKKDKMSNA
jgi:oligosaccharide repeat unit polymerase